MVQERAAAVTRHVGACQFCERTHKVQGGLVVLHGYQRPGLGHVEGRCPGEGRPPYELSCDLLKACLPEVRELAAALALRVAQLDAGAVFYFELATPSGYGRGARVVVETFSACVTDGYTWGNALETYDRRVRSELRQTEHELARLEERISAWRLRPLRTADERGQTEEERAEKATRAQERAAARAEKQAKADALKAKRDAKAAEQAVFLADVAARLAELAKTPGEASSLAGRRILADLDRTKARKVVGQWWWYDLEPLAGDALVALGLGERTGNGRVVDIR